MDGGKPWPFFHFRLNWPEVGSESEPKNSYGSSQTIRVFMSCICRTESSFRRPASLASSSSIHKLACANFSSAFQQRSLSAEGLFSAILTSSVRLSWWLLYHLTFLSDSEDALSSMWWTMFSHAIQKAFSTSCYVVILGANNRVAKSNGSDVRGTWLQLMCWDRKSVV